VLSTSALAILGLATMLIAWAPDFGVTLAGALAMGAGCGLLLSHVNAAVSAVGGVRALVQFTRSTLVAMLSSVTVPVVVGLGIAIGVGWQFVAMPALLLIAIAAAASWGRTRQAKADGQAWEPAASLPLWLLAACRLHRVRRALLGQPCRVARRVPLADATLTIRSSAASSWRGRRSILTIGRTDRDVLPRQPCPAPCWLAGGVGLGSYEPSVAAMLVGGVVPASCTRCPPRRLRPHNLPSPWPQACIGRRDAGGAPC
jgi:MFS family permease